MTTSHIGHQTNRRPPPIMTSPNGKLSDSETQRLGKRISRILIVDSNPASLRLLKLSFSKSDYLLNCFQSPAKALASAAENTYSVIICDQSMPNVTGHELINSIQMVQPQVRGIILCENNCESAHQNNYPNIFCYLKKPWDESELHYAVIEAVIAYHSDIPRERLYDQAKVSDGSMTKHRAYLRELEQKYPGITNIPRDENGVMILKHHCQTTQHDIKC